MNDIQIQQTPLIPENELMAWIGYHRRADLVKCLKKHGIRAIIGKDGRVCCTRTAIDRVLTGEQNQESDDFDI